MYKSAFLILAVMVAAAPAGSAGAASMEGMGILHGEDHAFALIAPEGWVVDNRSGVSQGLHAVFYPKDQTWTQSPVIAYARARTKKGTVRSVADQVRQTVDRFSERSDTPVKAFLEKIIPLENGRTAEVYHFTGDRYGSFEAVAYIDEAKTINFVVLSARDKPTFENALPIFEDLVKSYMVLGDDPSRIDSAD